MFVQELPNREEPRTTGRGKRSQLPELAATPQQTSRLRPSIYMQRRLEVAAEFGLNIQEVLRAINMRTETLAQGDDYYTIDQYVASLKVIRDSATIPGLGLLVGRRISIADLGILGFAMLSSPTLHKAMDVAIRFQSLINPVLRVGYRVDSNEVVVVVEPLFFLAPAYRNDIEEILALWQSILQNFSGVDIGCTSIGVTWPQPSYVALYAECFRCPISFSQKANEIRFPQYLLHHEMRLANDRVARICNEECDRVMHSLRSGHTILDSVRQMLLNASGQLLDLPKAAKELGVSPRHLRRRLAQVHTSFRKISLDVRMRIAIQYLLETSLAVEQIGFLVGYGESSNFHRAFKRHTGSTPLNYRKERHTT